MIRYCRLERCAWAVAWLVALASCSSDDVSADAAFADAPVADAAAIDARVVDASIPDAQVDAPVVGDAGVDAAPVADASSVDASVNTPPSCSGLSATCGPAGNDDCCASSIVSGGTYYRSYDVAADSHNDMSFPATVSSFRLERYEITVGRFRAFVAAGKGTQTDPPAEGSGAHPGASDTGWSSAWNTSLAANTAALITSIKCNPTYQSWTDTPGVNEQRPMNCISWYEAMAFCIWDGGYLPTEAEWNYAATGGDEQRAYAWSNPASSTTIDSSFAIYSGSGSLADVGSTSPKGDGRWGQADLAGNVWEWMFDWYVHPYVNPCVDCAILTGPSPYRVIRGGGYSSDVSALRAAFRSNFVPTSRATYLGARCVRPL